MSINTPIGNITQTTPIKDFKELDEMQNEQYLLGIDNNAVGNGSKISLENLINSSISTDNGNLITKGTDDKLLVNTPVEIGDLSNLTTTNKSTLVAAINEVDSDLTTEVTNRTNAVSAEATARANADNNLQTQIDAITAASDVTDIVGTYAELQAYDTTELPDNSIIKVLQDESRQNETTYYRWVITSGVGAWVLIGEEGPYYTISQADNKFATQATVGNLNNLATSDKSSVVNAMNELASVLDPTQTADYIKNSKAIYSGEVSENASILPQIQEMAHSTFDRSKFTVVGSPNITDDGIASGFSAYPNTAKTIRTSFIDLSKPCKIIERVTTGNTISAGAIFAGGSAGIALRLRSENTIICSLLLSDNTTLIAESYTNTIQNIQPNTNYICTYEWSGTQHFYRIFTENGVKIFERSAKSSVAPASGTIYLGTTYTDTAYIAFNGSIDLKQFSITVDGVEVFSGRKTGIDTIKPDDYTVVGSPTISADGVASGFSSGNYIQTPINLNNSKPFKYKLSFKTSTIANTTEALVGTAWNNAHVKIEGNQCRFYYNSSYYVGFAVASNTSYDIIAEYDGNTTIKLYYKQSSENEYNLTQNQTVEQGSNTSMVRISHWDNSLPQPFTGSIDLNSFKIYVDGNLVYQPCLKIPYTESKTGSKIVNEIYRDRVNDMADQFGYANYYTLDEENGNFTLPMGEIYGMLEHKSNIDLSNTTPAQTFKDNSIAWGMPDWSRIVAKTASTLYTATQRGWIEAVVSTVQPPMALHINGYAVAYCEASGADDSGGFGCLVPVDIGDSYQLIDNGGVISAFNFIPCKGEA